jgi:hypothetical protein
VVENSLTSRDKDIIADNMEINRENILVLLMKTLSSILDFVIIYGFFFYCNLFILCLKEFLGMKGKERFYPLSLPPSLCLSLLSSPCVCTNPFYNYVIIVIMKAGFGI